MSACTCKTDIEAKLLENFKAAKPEAKDHSVTLQGYGLAVVGNTLSLKPFMSYKAHAHYPRKAGGTRDKTLNGTMVFSFCPFCGTKLSEPKAAARAEAAEPGGVSHG